MHCITSLHIRQRSLAMQISFNVLTPRKCRESGRMHSRTVSSRINFPNAFKASIQKRGVLKCPHTPTLQQQCIMIYRGVCIETNQMKGGLMPRVGHVIFGEDSFGRDQAKLYARLSGNKVAPNPEIAIVIKGDDKRFIKHTKDLKDLISWYGG